METAIQIIILLLSASSIWIVGRKEQWSKWGYVIGLTAQPFWLYTTAINDQWGLFALSVFYSYSWSMGIYNRFYSKDEDEMPWEVQELHDEIATLKQQLNDVSSIKNNN